MLCVRRYECIPGQATTVVKYPMKTSLRQKPLSTSKSREKIEKVRLISVTAAA